MFEKDIERIRKINLSITNCFKNVKLDEFQLNKIRLDRAIANFCAVAKRAVETYKKGLEKY